MLKLRAGERRMEVTIARQMESVDLNVRSDSALSFKTTYGSAFEICNRIADYVTTECLIVAASEVPAVPDTPEVA